MLMTGRCQRQLLVTQVDCFESHLLVQNFADGAETFACEAHGCRPAFGVPVSCIGAVQRWGQGGSVVMLRAICGKKLMRRGLSVISRWPNDAGAVGENWREQKTSQKCSRKVGTSLLSERQKTGGFGRANHSSLGCGVRGRGN